MQLGEVFEQAAAMAPPPPRRRTRWRYVLPLLALGAVAGALVLHGPGVAEPEPHELLVVTNPTGIDLLGPEVRVITGKSKVFHVPVVTRVHRLPRQAQSPDPVSFTAHTADGVPLRFSRAGVTYRLDPGGAEAVFRRLGADVDRWDAHVRATLAATWTEVVARHPAVRLGEPMGLLHEVEPALRKALDGQFTVGELRPPEAAFPAEVEAALASLRAAEAARGAEGVARETQENQVVAEEKARAEARGAALDAARAEATRALEAARAQARARLAEARDQADAHEVEAIARREALTRQAEATRIRTPFEVEALTARVEALRTDGPALLDHVIATRIMPQLQALRAGAPAPVTEAP